MTRRFRPFLLAAALGCAAASSAANPWTPVGPDRGFEVTVTDTETGIPWTYFNPVGVVQSHADTSAF
jgi:hypothetical protein